MTISYDLFINNTLAASKTRLGALLEAQGFSVQSATSDTSSSNNQDVAALIAVSGDDPSLTFRIQFHHGPGASTVARAVSDVSTDAKTQLVMNHRFRAILLSLGDTLQSIGMLDLTTVS